MIIENTEMRQTSGNIGSANFFFFLITHATCSDKVSLCFYQGQKSRVGVRGLTGNHMTEGTLRP